MRATESDLYDTFKKLDIAYETIEHPAIFTVEQGRAYHHLTPGRHCKNLFLVDKKGEIWLALLSCDKRAHIGQLSKRIGSDRLSFGKADILMDVLGMTQGEVTPFSLLNDTEKRVSVVIDSEIMNEHLVNFHPLRNTASTALTSQDLLKFIKFLGYQPVIVNCGEA